MPVLVKASTSLILNFAPIIPPMFPNTCVQKRMSKDYSSKRSPWTSKIRI